MQLTRLERLLATYRGAQALLRLPFGGHPATNRARGVLSVGGASKLPQTAGQLGPLWPPCAAATWLLLWDSVGLEATLCPPPQIISPWVGTSSNQIGFTGGTTFKTKEFVKLPHPAP